MFPLDESNNGKASAHLALTRCKRECRVALAIKERCHIKMANRSLEVLSERLCLAAIFLIVLGTCSDQVKDTSFFLVLQIAQVEAGCVLVSLLVQAMIYYVSGQPSETCIASWCATFVS